MNDITIEYIAGLFDGEGCITRIRGAFAVGYCVQINITNTNRGVLEDVRSYFGAGSIQAQGVAYSWRVIGSKAITTVLTAFMPYLRIKRGQATLALQLCERVTNETGRQLHKAGRPISDEEYFIREGLSEQIMALNSAKGGA